MAGSERSKGQADLSQNLKPYPAASRVIATLFTPSMVVAIGMSRIPLLSGLRRRGGRKVVYLLICNY
jgi:hypothetical protein